MGLRQVSGTRPLPFVPCSVVVAWSSGQMFGQVICYDTGVMHWFIQSDLQAYRGRSHLQSTSQAQTHAACKPADEAQEQRPTGTARPERIARSQECGG